MEAAERKHRRRGWVLIFAFTVLGIFAGIAGPSAIPMFSQNLTNPNAESTLAEEKIRDATDQSVEDAIVLLVDTPGGFESEEAAQRIDEAVEILEQTDGVVAVGIPSEQAPQLISVDQAQMLVTGKIEEGYDPDEVAGTVITEVDDKDWLKAGGTAIIGHTIGETIGRDLLRAELIVFPVLVLLAMWIFRGPIPALAMVGIAGLVIGLAILALRVAVEFTDVTVYVMNLTIGLGIGLATDYCLLYISRYREEATIHGYGSAAVRATSVSAGRTVLFSAATVAMAMSALMIFPQTYFKSMGLGGLIVAVLSAIVTVTLLPAVLLVLGKHLELGVPRQLKKTVGKEATYDPESSWAKLAKGQMKHPWLTLAIAIGALLLMGLPSADVKFADTDVTTLPDTASAYQVEEAIERDFPTGGTATTFVAVDAAETDQAAVDELTSRIAEVENVEILQPASYVSDHTWVIVSVVDALPYTDESIDAVREIKTLSEPGLSTFVGGQTAVFIDQVDEIRAALPIVLAVIFAVVFFVILFLTGSMILPLKQLVLNALNASATLGVLVWAFQWGSLEGILNFTSHGTLDLLQPILVAIIAFALATDYGVLLLARIHEHYLDNRNNDEAVVRGFAETGRIITSAALLMMLAIGAFVTSEIVLIKILGFGVACAVGIDAFIMRSFLVPAAMKVLGPWNWWSPVRIPTFSHN